MLKVPARAARLAGLLGMGSLVFFLLGSSLPTPLRLFPDRTHSGPFGYSDAVEPLPERASAYPLRIEWRRELPREENFAWRQHERSRPIVLGDRLLFGTSRASGIFQLELRTGRLERRIKTKGPVDASITMTSAESDLFVGDMAGFIYRIKQDGDVVWEHESVGPVVTACTVDEHHVYYLAIDGSMVALEVDTGEQAWSYRRNASYHTGLAIFGASIPVVTEGGLLISGFEDGCVAAIRTADGQLAWERQLSVSERWTDVDGDPLLLDGDRVVISAYKGPTVCLRASTGEELWRVEGVGSSGQALSLGKMLYVADSNGSVTAMSSDTGERIWRWLVPHNEVPNSPVAWRGQLVVTDSRGSLYVLDPVGGTLNWQIDPDEEITGFSSPVSVGEGALYAVSDGGMVYAFSAQDYVATPFETFRASPPIPFADRAVDGSEKNVSQTLSP